MEVMTDQTNILFGSEEEISRRWGEVTRHKEMRKNIRRNTVEYEISNSLFYLMLLEGCDAELAETLRGDAQDEEGALTLSFLLSVLTLFGEDYVKEQILGREMTVEAARQKIRDDLLEEKIRPYREIYDNLDERIDAAIHAERQIDQEIMKLKMQLNYDKQMYENRLATERMRHQFEEGKLKSEGDYQHQSDREKIGRLEEEVKKLQSDLEERKAQAQQSAEAQSSLQEEARTAKTEKERLHRNLRKPKRNCLSVRLTVRSRKRRFRC